MAFLSPSMPLFWRCSLLLFCCAALSCLPLISAAVVGVNYGTAYSNGGPAAEDVVALLRRQSIGRVKLSDANGTMLKALAGTGIEVMITLPNTQLLGVGESNSTAANWVAANVLAYLPETNITSISVGTSVLSDDPNAALVLLPALRFLRAALSAANASAHIRLSSSFSPSLILDSFPPSQAFFNRSWTSSVISPLLDFLSNTSSFFLLDIFSYDIFRQANGVIDLDYALLNPITPDKIVTDPNTLFQYRNLFDAVVDAAFFALERLNHSGIPVVISATGWPSAGGDQATPDNAAIYNSNLIDHIVNGSGTPKRPRAAIDTYIYELFSEDTFVGSEAERNYGLFNATTLQPIYLLRLSNSGPLLANDSETALFCVAKPGADADALQIALDWACGIGQSNCSAIQPGQLCYIPDTVESHASYAFNWYYQSHSRMDGSCDFNGVATVSTTDPSNGVCVFPGSGNFTIGNATGSGNGTSSGNVSGGSNDTAAEGPTSAGTGMVVVIWGGRSLAQQQLGFTLVALFLVLAITSLF